MPVYVTPSMAAKLQSEEFMYKALFMASREDKIRASLQAANHSSKAEIKNRLGLNPEISGSYDAGTTGFNIRAFAEPERD